MRRNQELRPELVYRANSALNAAGKVLEPLGEDVLVSVSVFDPYVRRFHWLTVDSSRWRFSGDQWRSCRDNLLRLIRNNPDTWQAFRDGYGAERERLETIRQALSALEEEADDADRLHHALLMLHQFYPIGAREQIDGVVWRNLRRRSEQLGTDFIIDFATAELLPERRSELPFVRMPWAKVALYRQTNHGAPSPEIMYSSQEKVGEDFRDWPDIPADDGRVLSLGHESGQTESSPDFYWNLINPYFIGYRGGGITKMEDFVEIELEAYKYVAVLPLYSARIDGACYGSLCCNLQFARPREAAPWQASAVTRLGGELVEAHLEIVHEVKKSAIHEVLKQPIDTSRDDFLEHFVKYCTLLLDLESVSVYERNPRRDDVVLRYCYGRTAGNEWRRCPHCAPGVRRGGGVRSPGPADHCASCDRNADRVRVSCLEATDDLFDGGNEGCGPKRIVPLKHFIDPRFVPHLEREDYARYTSSVIVLEFPSYMVIPPDEADTGRLWHFMKRDLVDLLSQLALRWSMEVKAHREGIRQAVKHGSKAATTGIMSRNVSHNLGSHVISYWISERMTPLTERIERLRERATTVGEHVRDLLADDRERPRLSSPDARSRNSKIKLELCSIRDEAFDIGEANEDSIRLLRFLQRRVDFLATYSTIEALAESGLDLKNDILDPMIGGRPFGVQPILRFIAHSEDMSLTAKSFARPSTHTRVSVPNGSTGAHALYCILENFVRNAAKHCRGGRGAPGEPVFKIEVVPPILEVWRNRYYEVHIWDCRPHSANDETIADLVAYVDPESERGRLVDDDGSLNTKGWGFKEMRICANFLRNRVPEAVIGHVEEAKPPLLGLLYNGALIYSTGREIRYGHGQWSSENDNKLGITFFLHKPLDMVICGDRPPQRRTGRFVVDVWPRERLVDCDRIVPHKLLVVDSTEGIDTSDPRLPCRIVERSDLPPSVDAALFMGEYRRFLQELNGGSQFPYLLFVGGNDYAELFRDGDLRDYGSAASPADVFVGLDKAQRLGRRCALFYYHADRVSSDVLKPIRNNDRVHYFQPLSAKYLINHKLTNPPRDLLMKEHFLLELLESLITPVVIVDERVSEAAKNPWAHGLCIGDVWQRMGIHVIPVEPANIGFDQLTTTLRACSIEGLSPLWLPGGRQASPSRSMRILESPVAFVVHAGILDKLEKERPGNALRFCEGVNARWKAIDSGRGVPSSIPACMRFVEVSALISQLEDFDKHGLVQLLFASRAPNPGRGYQ